MHGEKYAIAAGLNLDLVSGKIDDTIRNVTAQGIDAIAHDGEAVGVVNEPVDIVAYLPEQCSASRPHNFY
ncbi:hypothetical protein LCGC14_2099820 [marine sediment metagenome]|uniref:Uncharacterized protein n=1 Tax=marine sediment metagenome TaxID=412755 RepID=A0A0F9H6Q5_9ZZZZ